ncbi:uncharacterized protein TNCV_2135461 [Trichonephila clavipes]|nr:uncharacterized protein TNCV_2135461 [Trichonephila clavipes]
MNSTDDFLFNLSTPPSTHNGTLVSLEPIKKIDSQRRSRLDPRRQRSRRLPQVFFHTQGLAVLKWENVPFAIRRNVIVGLPCKACVPFTTTPYIPFFTRDLSEKYKSERCFEHFSFIMDPIDVFPEHISTTVVPVTLLEKPDVLEYATRQGQVQAGMTYQEPNAKRVFVLFSKDHWH